MCKARKRDLFVFVASLVTQTVLLSEDLLHVLANISLVLVPLNKSLILYQLNSTVGRVVEKSIRILYCF